MNIENPYTDCCNVTTYYAEANSTAKAYTSTGELVTSTSSATATSHVSYDDALEIAQKIADTVAQSNADHDAHVIDEAVTISNGNNDDVVVLENLSSSNNEYQIEDNTDRIYIKGSTGNATNLSDQIFPLGNVTNLDLNGSVYSLEKDNSGNVYAGGDFAFTNNTNIQLNGIGKWDGNVWNSLDNGFLPSTRSQLKVYSVKIDNSGNLYAGGNFKYAFIETQTILNSIAVWNGSIWNALGTGLANGNDIGTANTISVDSYNNIYVGGFFTSAGTVANTSGIAKWNGSVWSALGEGVNINLSTYVNTSAIDSSNNLYIGGNFTFVKQTNSTPITVNGIAKWDGTNWYALGLGLVDGDVQTLVVDSSNNNLYIGGSFTQVEQTDGTKIDVYGIAKWDGSVWSKVGSGFKILKNNFFNNNATVTALEFDSSKNLIACGIFEKLQDNSKFLYNIAKWNGTNWNSVGNGIHDSNNIYGILLSDENEIIIGANNPIKPINAYYNYSSYISKISNNYVNLNYNNERLITQYYNGQSTSIKTIKNNSSNKKVGYVYSPSYNDTETYV